MEGVKGVDKYSLGGLNIEQSNDTQELVVDVLKDSQETDYERMRRIIQELIDNKNLRTEFTKIKGKEHEVLILSDDDGKEMFRIFVPKNNKNDLWPYTYEDDADKIKKYITKQGFKAELLAEFVWCLVRLGSTYYKDN